MLEKKTEIVEEEEIDEDDPFPVPYSKKNAKFIRFQDNSRIVILNNWEEGEATQTQPPTKTIDEQFPASYLDIPTNFIDYSNKQSWRSTTEETKVKDLL